MTNIVRFLGQAITMVAFLALIGYFSTAPAYVHLESGQALLKLSFTHAGERKGDCRQRTPEELAKLPPNMRAQLDCPRERVPVVIELELDGKLLDHEVMPPRGLSKDGAASVYQRYVVPAGTHRIVARLKDREGAEFNYRTETEVTLAPAQVLVLDFRPIEGGFIFK